jgi:phosphoglycolate phosphatase
VSTKTLLITDLDNTLWDWFEMWYESFAALLAGLSAASGIPASELEPEIRKVHQRRGTTEYSWLIGEVPSLVEAAAGADLNTFYDEALHAQSSARLKHTSLYPGVMETLEELRRRGVMIAAYTESVAFWTEWRIKKTGLDGVIDRLYSAPDHDHPDGVSLETLRSMPEDQYGLKVTVHEHVPAGTLKPNVRVLRSILDDCGRNATEAVYVGDSLMKDVAMAQGAGVLDLHAKYGEPQWRPEYGLLQRVTHWPGSHVDREQDLGKTEEIVPSVVLAEFAEVLTVFDGAA